MSNMFQDFNKHKELSNEPKKYIQLIEFAGYNQIIKKQLTRCTSIWILSACLSWLPVYCLSLCQGQLVSLLSLFKFLSKSPQPMDMEVVGERHSGVPRLVRFLSSLLERIAVSNDTCRAIGSSTQNKVTVFHGLTRPPISLGSYMERIFTYANCSPCCYAIAYIYLDRFVQRYPLLSIDSFNIHRLLITSVMAAAKFMDDM